MKNHEEQKGLSLRVRKLGMGERVRKGGSGSKAGESEVLVGQEGTSALKHNSERMDVSLSPVWARAPPALLCVCEGGGGGGCTGVSVFTAPCGHCGDASWGG